jgi:hypothetical protein
MTEDRKMKAAVEMLALFSCSDLQSSPIAADLPAARPVPQPISETELKARKLSSRPSWFK